MSDKDEQIKSAVTCAVKTDIGRKRDENQDSYGVLETDHYQFFIVADGMGGVQGGAMASQTAVKVVEDCLADKETVRISDLVSSVHRANQSVFEKGIDDPDLSGMGTTFVGLCFCGGELVVINVGDSRAYRIRKNEIAQLTEDHTLVTELLRSGAITEDQVKDHPVSHMLTRSLGPTPSIEVDCWFCEDPPEKLDRYLLCSDGLYNLVEDEEIREIVESMAVDEAAAKLVDLANERGGTDNITVIVLEVVRDILEDEEEKELWVNEDNDTTSTIKINKEMRDSLSKEEEESPSVTDTVEDLKEVLEGVLEDSPVEEVLQEPVSVVLDSEQDPAPEPEEEEPQSGERKSSFEGHLQGFGKALDEVSADDVPTQRMERSEHVVPSEASDSHSSEKSELQPEAEAQAEPLTGGYEPAGDSSGNLFKIFIAGALGILSLSTITLGYLYYKSGSAAKQPIPAVIEQEPVVEAPVQMKKAPGAALVETIVPEEKKIPDLAGDMSDFESRGMETELEEDEIDLEILANLTESDLLGIDSADIHTVGERKKVLVSLIEAYQEKLDSLGGPISSSAADTLANSEEAKKRLTERLVKIDADFDYHTRKLKIWYGRQERLKGTDEIKLASQVAANSEDVRLKEKAFEESTWAYLREEEKYRYNPEDKEQKKYVLRLLRKRKEALLALKGSVRKAVKEQVSLSEKKIAELTIEKDKVEAELVAVEREEEFVKILLGSDPKQKEAVLEALRKKKTAAEEELVELSELSQKD